MEQPVAAPTTDPLEILKSRYDTGNRDLHEPPTAPTSAAPAPASQEPASASHPDYLRATAESLGMDDGEINALSTHDLATSVRVLSRRLQHERLAEQRFQRMASVLPQQGTPASQSQFDAPGSASGMGASQGQQAAPADPLDFRLDEDALHPEILSALEALRTEVKALRELRGTVTKTSQIVQQTSERSKWDLVDAAFAALGPEAAKLLGDGDRFSFDKDSPQLARRVAVMQSTGLRLMQLPASEVPSLPVLTAKLRTAYSKLFGSVPSSSPAPEEELDPYSMNAGGGRPLEGQQEPAPSARTLPRDRNGRFTRDQWDEAATMRPTHRSGGNGDVSPRDAAIAAVREKMARQEAGES